MQSFEHIDLFINIFSLGMKDIEGFNTWRFNVAISIRFKNATNMIKPALFNLSCLWQPFSKPNNWPWFVYFFLANSRGFNRFSGLREQFCISIFYEQSLQLPHQCIGQIIRIGDCQCVLIVSSNIVTNSNGGEFNLISMFDPGDDVMKIVF